jgi:hypothetical protein
MTVASLLDCAPSLEGCVSEVEAALAFTRRTGSEQVAQWLDSYRWLARVLRGEHPAAADEPVPIDRYADNLLAIFYARCAGALAATIFGDRPAWRGTPQRRCRFYRPPWAFTQPPGLACCAGWPSRERSARLP